MLRDIQFRLKLFEGPKDHPRSRRALLWLMEGLCAVNGTWLQTHRSTTPGIYQSGVLYQTEPDEYWQDIPSMLENRWGDCEDLACWRVAELRAIADINAHPFIKWQVKPDGGYLYHVVCQYPDGKLEDPSLTLGMHGVHYDTPQFVKDSPPFWSVKKPA